MNKKIFSLFIVAFIMISLVPTVIAAESDYIENGSFDSWSAILGYIDPWSGLSNDVTLTKSERKSGRYSVKISAGGGTSISQVVDVYPGMTMTVSAYIKQVGLTAPGARIKLEMRDIEGNSKAEWHMDYMPLYTDNDWHEYSGTFTVPEDVYSLTLLIRLYQEGTIYVDDVSLKTSDAIPPVGLSTDRSIYYTEHGGNINASVSLHTSAYPALVGGNVKFSLLDGETPLDTVTKNVITENDQLTYEAPVSKMTQSGKEYTVRATAFSKTGTDLGSVSTPVYRYDLPEFLGTDGKIYVNENVFHPVYFYHTAHNDEGVKRVKQMGANTMLLSNQMFQTPETAIKVLDICKENGMKALARLYFNGPPASDPDIRDYVENYIQKICNHEALLGYIIMDEPGGKLGINYEDELMDSYNLVRKYDTKHPILINEVKNCSLPVSARYCDIFTHDPYPGNSATDAQKYTTYVAESMENAITAANGRLTFAVLQAYPWQSFTPTAASLRHMIYQAVYSEVGGLGFYSSSSVWDNEPLKNALLDFAKNEKAALLTGMDGTTILKEIKSGCRVRVWQNDGKTYALVLNDKSNEPIQTFFRMGDAFSVSRIGTLEKFGFGASDKLISMSLPAGGAALICIDGETTLQSVPEGEITQTEKTDIEIGTFNAEGGFENATDKNGVLWTNWKTTGNVAAVTYSNVDTGDGNNNKFVVITKDNTNYPEAIRNGISGNNALRMEMQHATANYMLMYELKNQQPGTLFKLTGRFYIHTDAVNGTITTPLAATLSATSDYSQSASYWQGNDSTFNPNNAGSGPAHSSGEYKGADFYNKWVDVERYFMTTTEGNLYVSLKALVKELNDNYIVWDDIKLEKVENDVLFDEEGNRITSGKSYKGKVLMGNITAEPKTYVGFKALYEKMDDNSTRLISVEKFDITVPAQRTMGTLPHAGAYRRNFTFDLSDTEVYSADKDYMAKVMIWDSLTRMQPISIGELD